MFKDIRSYFSLSILLLALPSQASLPPDPPSPVENSSENPLSDFRAPSYTKTHPQWALELTTSLNAFGSKALIQEQGSNPIYAFSLLAELQPSFLQTFGILGIGPSVTSYQAFDTAITHGFLDLLGVGGQIRYQARYFREQPLVPVAAYSIEAFNYRFQNTHAGTLVAHGPSIGLWLLLNFLDSSTAALFYATHGVSRSYLVLEYRYFTGQDSYLSLSGGSTYFGLRVEF